MNNYISMEKHLDYVEYSAEKYKDLAFEYSCLKEDFDDLEEKYKKLCKDSKRTAVLAINLAIIDIITIVLFMF